MGLLPSNDAAAAQLMVGLAMAKTKAPAFKMRMDGEGDDEDPHCVDRGTDSTLVGSCQYPCPAHLCHTSDAGCG